MAIMVMNSARRGRSAGRGSLAFGGRRGASATGSSGSWDQKCTSKGLVRQGTVLEHRTSLQKEPVPCRPMPLLCSSDGATPPSSKMRVRSLGSSGRHFQPRAVGADLQCVKTSGSARWSLEFAQRACLCSGRSCD